MKNKRWENCYVTKSFYGFQGLVVISIKIASLLCNFTIMGNEIYVFLIHVHFFFLFRCILFEMVWCARWVWRIKCLRRWWIHIEKTTMFFVVYVLLTSECKNRHQQKIINFMSLKTLRISFSLMVQFKKKIILVSIFTQRNRY